VVRDPDRRAIGKAQATPLINFGAMSWSAKAKLASDAASAVRSGRPAKGKSNAAEILRTNFAIVKPPQTGFATSGG
jgi:hypothetical protein